MGADGKLNNFNSVTVSAFTICQLLIAEHSTKYGVPTANVTFRVDRNTFLLHLRYARTNPRQRTTGLVAHPTLAALHHTRVSLAASSTLFR